MNNYKLITYLPYKAEVCTIVNTSSYVCTHLKCVSHVIEDREPPQLTANAVLMSSLHSKRALMLGDELSLLCGGHGVLALGHTKCIFLVCLFELVDPQLVKHLSQVRAVFTDDFNRANL